MLNNDDDDMLMHGTRCLIRSVLVLWLVSVSHSKTLINQQCIHVSAMLLAVSVALSVYLSVCINAGQLLVFNSLCLVVQL